MRSVYQFLLWLHPAEFRGRFGDEMLCIFDEAGAGWRAASFIADACLSLARQWFLRPAIWKWIGASIGATVPLIFSFGSFLPWTEMWSAVRAYF
jgi:hypothetical protein